MHIGEGILTATPAGQAALLAGTLAAAAGTMIGLRRLDEDQIPKAAVLGTAFFVASAIQVPMGYSSVHLVLSGLMGLVLGWAVFPTVLVGLTLQFVFFSIAGPTVLGINTLIMALPGVICYYLFRWPVRSNRQWVVFASGFAAGSIALVLGALLSSAALVLAGQQFVVLAKGFLAVHIPVALVEGLVTGSVVVLLRQVRPEILAPPCWRPWHKRSAMASYWSKVGQALGGSMVLTLFLLCPAPALAHKLYVFAQVEGNAIQGRAYFPGDVPAQESVVIARDPSGRELGRTTTDDEGKFTFPPREHVDYCLTAETPDGHSATLRRPCLRTAG